MKRKTAKSGVSQNTPISVRPPEPIYNEVVAISEETRLSKGSLGEMLFEALVEYRKSKADFEMPFRIISKTEYEALQALKDSLNHPELLMLLDPEKARQMEDARSRDPKLGKQSA